MSSATLCTMIWQPAFSPVGIVTGACLLGALCVWMYLRQEKHVRLKTLPLALLRLFAIIAITVSLLGPARQEEPISNQRLPRLHILIDQSGSMSVNDVENQTRFGFTQKHWLNDAQLRELESQFQVSYQTFGDSFTPIQAGQIKDLPVFPTGESSPIADALDKVIAQTDSSDHDTSVLLISDGIDTDDASLANQARKARQNGLRIHTTTIGAARLARDLAITVATDQSYLFAREKGRINVSVYHVGYAGQPVTIRVKTKGEQITQEARMPNDGPLNMEFEIQENEPGEHAYEVSVDPLPGEREETNNTQQVFQQVIDSKIKVLVLEGEPFWDTKFLAHSLRKDERIELHTLTQLSVDQRSKIITGYSDSISSPDTLSALAEYDVVILGRALHKILSDQVIAQLPNYVSQHGGRIIFARGRAYDPTTPNGRQVARSLSALEPVTWRAGSKQNLSWSPSLSGIDSPVFSFVSEDVNLDEELAQIPAFTSMNIVDREKPAARTLAYASATGSKASQNRSGVPALLMMPYGRGHVAMLAGEGLWRWRLAPEGLSRFHTFYDMFWSNLVRWLAMASDFQPGAQVTLNLPSTQVKHNEITRLQVSIKNAGNPSVVGILRVKDPLGNIQTLPLQQRANEPSTRFTNFIPQTQGVHEVTLISETLTPRQQTRRFNVYKDQREMLNLSSHFSGMKRLSQNTGGLTLDQYEYKNWVQTLRAQRVSMSAPGKAVYLWSQWWVLALVLVWLGAEWIIRRKAGLS